MLAGQIPGYVYQRDGHPNGDQLAEQCRLLHGAERAVITSSGMAALSAAVLSSAATCMAKAKRY
jgi:cystathionine beta-lyase/cystathionine gamma-synthase